MWNCNISVNVNLSNTVKSVTSDLELLKLHSKSEDIFRVYWSCTPTLKKIIKECDFRFRVTEVAFIFRDTQVALMYKSSNQWELDFRFIVIKVSPGQYEQDFKFISKFLHIISLSSGNKYNVALVISQTLCNLYKIGLSYFEIILCILKSPSASP